VQFGREVTPNQHAIAEQFVLFDNLYDSGSLSADGHQWVTQAFAPDYIEKSFGAFTRTYPFNGGDALAYARSGFLWDNALRHNRSVRVYGEYVNGLRADGVEMGPWSGTFLGHGVTEAGTWSDFYRDAQLLAAGREADLHVQLEAHSDIPSLQAIINKKFPPYHMVIPDQYRVEVFLREFEQYVQKRSLPDLVIMVSRIPATIAFSDRARSRSTPRRSSSSDKWTVIYSVGTVCARRASGHECRVRSGARRTRARRKRVLGAAATGASP
jgi:hypothetical protein